LPLPFPGQAIVFAQPALAGFDDRPGRLLRLLAEDLKDDDGIGISPVYDAERPPASLMRSSWHQGPMAGIGRECGRPNVSPRCNNLSKYPASILASLENGGVFTSPRSQTIGLLASGLLIRLARLAQSLYVRYDMVSIQS